MPTTELPALKPADVRGALRPGSRLRSQSAAWAWLLVPLACHFGFSWIGFNPTDDGWLQAVARRLAEGEVPHRDFIFIRPALSAWLQVPLVWWGGDHVIWLARLWGWITLAAVCWLWSGRTAAQNGPLVRFVLYATAVFVSAHSFPVMAWHSFDGMLFATVAVVLLSRDTPGRRRLAFFTAGLAILCRQNFVVFPPLLLLAIGGKPATWVSAAFWSALPLLLYVAGIAAAGGAADLFQQFLATRGTFGRVAIYRYGPEPWFWSGIAAGLMLAWVLPRAHSATQKGSRHLREVIFLGVALILATGLGRGSDYFQTATLGLLGLVLGLGIPAIVRGVSPGDRLTLVAVPALAWATSISFGYNYPSLMSGGLLLVLWMLLHPSRAGTAEDAPSSPTTALPVVLTAAVAVAVAFSHARKSYPYRDLPSEELRHDAGLVLRGASGLRTSEVTFGTLAELSALMTRFESEHRRFAVLTDCPAVWIRNPSRNPLPCEWPQETELGHDRALFVRVFQGLAQMPPGSRVIVQKFLISEHKWGTIPIPSNMSYYHAQHWVRRACQKIGETKYFEVYLPPAAAIVPTLAPAPAATP